MITHVLWGLFALLMLLQLGDILTTNKILAKAGGVELNPVEAWCMKVLGSVWWVPKVLGVSAAGYLCVYMLLWYALLLVVALYCWVVWHNYQQLTPAQ